MNKYEILSTIGEGEYGIVRKARNRENEELVAIKKFKEDTDEENKKIILREVKVLKMMRHENITEFKEAFRNRYDLFRKGRVYLVCEYVEKNLLQIMEEVRCLDPERVRYLMYQFLKGIEYMHSIDLIHRDLKPENLLINSDDTLKICDFGFTRTVSNSKMTDYVATRWYRAPELLLNRDDYDKSVDIWAAGCIFAEMTDSEPLFPGESEVDQLYLMQRCLGPLCPDHQEYFLKHPRFVGIKFPEVNTIESLDRRYMGKLDKDGLDLLKRMLKMNPRERITAAQALKRPYFTKIAGLGKSANPVSANTRRGNTIIPNSIQDSTSPHLPFPQFKTAKDERDRTRDDKSKDEKGGLNTNKVMGVNKIKGINTGSVSTEEPGNLIYSTKSKIIQNIQNKISMGPGGKSESRQTQQPPPDKLIKKQQFQYLLQKKTKSPQDGRNYIPDFEQEVPREQTPIIKSRDNFRRKRFVEDQQIPQTVADQSSKTPTITKMLKKKLSKYNGVFHQNAEDEPRRKGKQQPFVNHYDVDDFDHAGMGNFRRQQTKQQGNYNIIFNNNTFNYNYRK